MSSTLASTRPLMGLQQHKSGHACLHYRTDQRHWALSLALGVNLHTCPDRQSRWPMQSYLLYRRFVQRRWEGGALVPICTARSAHSNRLARKVCNRSRIKAHTTTETSRLAYSVQFPRPFVPACLPAGQAGSPRKVDVVLFGAEFYEPPLSTLRSKPSNRDRCCWCSAALLVDHSACCSKHSINVGSEVL